MLPCVALSANVSIYFFGILEGEFPRRFGENVSHGAARDIGLSWKEDNDIYGFPRRQLGAGNFHTASRLNRGG